MIDDPLGTAVWYYYHYDGLGSVVALSNISGTVVEKYAYDAFGKTTVTLNGSTDNPYRFTGRRWDDETSLYYYRARMYSPALGRFLQTDPIGYYDGMNMYTYCGNNPIVYIDPWGLCETNKGFLGNLWEGWYDFWYDIGYNSVNVSVLREQTAGKDPMLELEEKVLNAAEGMIVPSLVEKTGTTVGTCLVVMGEGAVAIGSGTLLTAGSGFYGAVEIAESSMPLYVEAHDPPRNQQLYDGEPIMPSVEYSEDQKNLQEAEGFWELVKALLNKDNL